eukprot:714082_1
MHDDQQFSPSYKHEFDDTVKRYCRSPLVQCSHCSKPLKKRLFLKHLETCFPGALSDTRLQEPEKLELGPPAKRQKVDVFEFDGELFPLPFDSSESGPSSLESPLDLSFGFDLDTAPISVSPALGIDSLAENAISLNPEVYVPKFDLISPSFMPEEPFAREFPVSLSSSEALAQRNCVSSPGPVIPENIPTIIKTSTPGRVKPKPKLRVRIPKSEPIKRTVSKAENSKIRPAPSVNQSKKSEQDSADVKLKFQKSQPLSEIWFESLKQCKQSDVAYAWRRRRRNEMRLIFQGTRRTPKNAIPKHARKSQCSFAP